VWSRPAGLVQFVSQFWCVTVNQSRRTTNVRGVAVHERRPQRMWRTVCIPLPNRGTTVQERRTARRCAVSLECDVEGTSGLDGGTRISDLSTTGCYVDTRLAVSVGSPVTIRVTLVGNRLTLPGYVAHTHPGIGFGMRFSGLPDATRTAIEEFLGPPSDPR
jgi:hypothetical protein